MENPHTAQFAGAMPNTVHDNFRPALDMWLTPGNSETRHKLSS